MDNAQVLTALENARNYILEHGWAKGRFRNSYGRVCALGSVYAGNGYHNQKLGDSNPKFDWMAAEFTYVEYALNRALENLKIPKTFGIVHYNDLHDTTEADVLSVFDEAILMAKQQISDEG